MVFSAKVEEMCICVDCHWVDRCKTYHTVETQHGVDHLNATPDIQPKEPKIHISLNSLSNNEAAVEWDVRSCKSFLKDQDRWIKLCPGKQVPT